MARSLLSSFVNILLPAALAVYIVIRIGINTFSWQPGPDEVSTGSAAHGEKYAALLAGEEKPTLKIEPLWKLTAGTSGWRLPAWSGDPLPLARTLAERAKNFANSGNIAQAASHLKILLLWSEDLLTATGPGAANDHALDVTEIAIATLIECPGTLRYTKLGALAESLSQTLAIASRTRIANLLADLSVSETGDTPRNLRLMANKDVLRTDLHEIPDNGRDHLTRLTIKSWLLVCPRNPSLLRDSLQDLDSARIRSQQLRQQLDSLLDGTRPPLPE